jgi:hypothetical protein
MRVSWLCAADGSGFRARGRQTGYDPIYGHWLVIQALARIEFSWQALALLAPKHNLCFSTQNCTGNFLYAILCDKGLSI